MLSHDLREYSSSFATQLSLMDMTLVHSTLGVISQKENDFSELISQNFVEFDCIVLIIVHILCVYYLLIKTSFVHYFNNAINADTC